MNVSRLAAKEEKKRKALADAGIEYDFPGIVRNKQNKKTHKHSHNTHLNKHKNRDHKQRK